MILTVVAGFWLFRGRRTPVTGLTLATLLTVVGEGLLGWQVVASVLAPVLVLVHLAIALVILALMVAIFILAAPAPVTALPDRSFVRLVLVATGLTYLVLLTGSSVVATSADLVCKSWPLCGGGLTPDFSGVAFFAMLHRLTVGVVYSAGTEGSPASARWRLPPSSCWSPRWPSAPWSRSPTNRPSCRAPTSRSAARSGRASWPWRCSACGRAPGGGPRSPMIHG